MPSPFPAPLLAAPRRNAARLFLSLARRIDRGVFAPSLAPRDCPICGFHGPFAPAGLAPRPDAACPGCGSMERHRLLHLAMHRHGLLVDRPRVIHFAPDSLRRCIEPHASDYVTADLFMPGADLAIDIEAMPEVADARFDLVICIHVLEHVDDAKALREIRRILRPGGTAVLSVPLIEGMDTTYEDASITSPAARRLHFGQPDHVRQFGRDFRDRVRAAGFELAEFGVDGAEAVRCSIGLGERVFLARRPA